MEKLTRYEEVFLEELKKFYMEHADKKILLVSSTENYIRLISNKKNKIFSCI